MYVFLGENKGLIKDIRHKENQPTKKKSDMSCFMYFFFLILY